jgi:putative transposase
MPYAACGSDGKSCRPEHTSRGNIPEFRMISLPCCPAEFLRALSSMGQPRIFDPGFSHHVRHRGNNSSDIFRDDNDRHHFLALLHKKALRRHVAVHGYVLMTTHFHLLLTGSDADSLPRLMQALGRCYVRYFNYRHRRTGTLWEGRYWASLVTSQRYWFTCLRYIEMNAVAARMVASPAAYPWSSYHANALGRTDILLTPHPLYLQLGSDAPLRAANWSALCGQPISEADKARIRAAIRLGTVLSDDEADGLPEGIAS